MNMQRSIICELMFYEFELDHNTVEATKKHLLLKMWGLSWSHSDKQRVEEISLKLQESQRSGKVK